MNEICEHKNTRGLCDIENCTFYFPLENSIESKEECPYCDINIPLKKHNEELFQWHLNGHGKPPQEPKKKLPSERIKELIKDIVKEGNDIDYKIIAIIRYLDETYGK